MDIGETAPTWTKLPGVDGKEHSLSDLKDKDVVVVAFTCNSCPYAEDYESRLIDFANRYCVAKSSLKNRLRPLPGKRLASGMSGFTARL